MQTQGKKNPIRLAERNRKLSLAATKAKLKNQNWSTMKDKDKDDLLRGLLIFTGILNSNGDVMLSADEEKLQRK